MKLSVLIFIICFSLTLSLLTKGSTDVVCTKASTGTFKCTPFYMTFGVISAFTSSTAQIKIKVNGVDSNARMTLDKNYFFTFEKVGGINIDSYL